MYHISFIHSSVHGHLGCFYVLAIVNSAAMNIGGACIFSNFSFLQIYAQEWDCYIQLLLFPILISNNTPGPICQAPQYKVSP